MVTAPSFHYKFEIKFNPYVFLITLGQKLDRVV